MATEELYHVRLTVRGEGHDEVRLDLDREGLEQRFLRPYREGRTITVNGRSVASGEVQRIRVTASVESAEAFRPAVEQQLRNSSVVALGGPSMTWLLAAKGRDVTDDLISGPPGYVIAQENLQLGGSGQPLAVVAGARGPGDRHSVFLVHGRDASAAAAMRDLLRAFGLRIIEWEHALQHLDQGPSPYVGDIVMAGMRLADAVVVLFTPDDLVSLRQDLTEDGDEETAIQGQARPNVIYEAGIADALDRARTLLVEVGRVKGLSDLGGRNTVGVNGSNESRRQLASRLRSAKLDVDDMGVSWLSAGDFGSSLNAARAALSGGEAASSSTSWTSLAEPADASQILFLLKSKIGAQMVRPHACDVRGPQADVFARAVIDRTGPAVRVQCTYPRDFTAAMSFVPGQYDVVWYESDEKKGWREVLRASHQITLLDR